MMTETSEVSLGTISAVVSPVQRVVARYFGPQCSQTLLTSQTGKAVVTSDGFTILQTLQPSHPVAVLVAQSIRRCHSHTMDGAKSFLLYLSFFLEELDKAVQMGVFCHDGTSFSGNRHTLVKQSLISVQKSLQGLRCNILPPVISMMENHSKMLLRSLRGKTEPVDLLISVCETTLGPHFNPKMCRYFANLLRDLVIDDDAKGYSLMSRLQLMVDKFDLITVKVPNRPYSDCVLMDAVLVQRDFSVFDEGLTSAETVTALLTVSFEDSTSEHENSEVFYIRASSNISSNLYARHKAVDTFVKNCVTEGINLFVCGENVPTFALTIFKQYKVSVISNVLEDDLELLILATNKTMISSVYDVMGKSNIITLFGVVKVIVGGQQYVCMKTTQSSCIKKHLIVCAPSIGLCDQLTQMLQKSLNSMLLCFDSKHLKKSKNKFQSSSLNTVSCSDNTETSQTYIDNFEGMSVNSNCVTKSSDAGEKKTNFTPEGKDTFGADQDTDEDEAVTDIELKKLDNLLLFEGGGSFELLLTKLLADYSISCKNANEKVICKALGEAMMRVVGMLYDNVAESGEGPRAFLAVRTHLLEGLSVGQLPGLTRRGSIRDVSDGQVLEPLPCKIHVLECVLELVGQLLKVDMVVSAK